MDGSNQWTSSATTQSGLISDAGPDILLNGRADQFVKFSAFDSGRVITVFWPDAKHRREQRHRARGSSSQARSSARSERRRSRPSVSRVMPHRRSTSLRAGCSPVSVCTGEPNNPITGAPEARTISTASVVSRVLPIPGSPRNITPGLLSRPSQARRQLCCSQLRSRSRPIRGGDSWAAVFLLAHRAPGDG